MVLGDAGIDGTLEAATLDDGLVIGVVLINGELDSTTLLVGTLTDAGVTGVVTIVETG